MAGKPTRGVFQTIWKHFIESVKPRRFRGDLVGTDHFGTKYYETPLHSTSSKKKPPRYFEPVNKDDFQQEVPAEWEAWLRYRRKEPPSDAEVLQSLALMKTKKKNAAELESALEATRSSKSKPAPLPEAIGFPTYKDYQYPEGFKDSKE
ncbi:NADH dehydrogenase [ubiquinone] 1 alpha subcomplex assembly factor 2 isoform X1 [Neodiprion lecontei]|uniref:Mimitin, mitochondrial isoform X1 n=1 Tax=Neodiprion lecontei TaxID=441921 RepID=A0A6J0BBP1_NEOLC|nr:NADH dehydrogenase [ubiquinone] 1 alpha subcomplex assembly factor 2 isoform X1 [Neodiprion lecontei]XP_015511111.1 NADH dehydrogenase [ubiquinone] 1 alpha subcomplex assembly factor 2 isoform X1 [Neodiprion lecontei]XP_046428840.1 NADH dehydrogenase [ubiquinone] 1 alpha subcomplex assembly factor 2 isoform X1 [Neodiprion fabricii]XP_046428841.1 NADH dehydrogenase [ubiquinone] 1 alpha subcomplex assembly factor 2 isoform X1 [Neodiprion fabricii]XP_046428842.1 NADH dehydrogenase [ubiquinone] 